MKEIVLIAAYTPTEEKENILRNLVNKLKSFNYKVAVCSHSIVPIDVFKKCDFVFYDRENKIIFDPSFQYWYHDSHNLPNGSKLKFIFKPYNTMSSHILPIVSMVYGSLQYLKFLNYDIVHHIEYDTVLFDADPLNYNSEILKEYDCVSYFSDSLKNKDKYLIGHLFSFRIPKLNLEGFKYNEEHLISLEKEYFSKGILPSIERIIYNLSFKDLNIFWVPITQFKDSLELNISEKLSSYHKDICTFNLVNNILYFYSNNKSGETQKIMIVINESIVKSFNQDLMCWNWISLEINFDEIRNLKLFINDSLIKNFNMDLEEDRDFISKWSKIENS